MDDFETARQQLAQATRTLRLLNFRFVQLRHTHDQLLAGLLDLLTQTKQAPEGDAPRPQIRKDPPS